jgi:hypothetical protein
MRTLERLTNASKQPKFSGDPENGSASPGAALGGAHRAQPDHPAATGQGIIGTPRADPKRGGHREKAKKGAR